MCIMNKKNKIKSDKKIESINKKDLIFRAVKIKKDTGVVR